MKGKFPIDKSKRTSYLGKIVCHTKLTSLRITSFRLMLQYPVHHDDHREIFGVPAWFTSVSLISTRPFIKSITGMKGALNMFNVGPYLFYESGDIIKFTAGLLP